MIYSKGEEGLQAFDMTKAIKEQADYVVFNGAVGAVAGSKSITAKLGEKARLYLYSSHLRETRFNILDV